MNLNADERDALNETVRILNTVGREAAEYLAKILLEEDNEEAAAWIEVDL